MKIIKFNSFNESIDDVTKLKGWVNIKIDEQVYVRMGRHVKAMDTLLTNRDDKYNLYEKVNILSKVDEYVSKLDVDIQTKLSLITILQYLNELRSNFNPSSSGFLLEGFLAALIHGEITSDYGSTDMTGRLTKADITKRYSDLDAPQYKTDRVKYQIKLYKKGNNIKLDIRPERICDYYVICLKDVDNKIDINIIPYDELNKYKVISSKELDNIIIINTNKLYKGRGRQGNEYMTSLDVSDSKINQSIGACGENIRKSIEDIYLNLSELEFDIDSIMTGYNKNNVKIDIETAKRTADFTINNIQNSIKNFKI